MVELEKDTLKAIDKNIAKSITELGKKPEINPAETKAFLDGMQAREWIACEMDKCEMKEQEEEMKKGSYRGYSGHDQPYRRYNITAYGDPAMMSTRTPHMNVRYSGDYGVQGWYRSNNDPMYQAGVYPLDEYDERNRSYDGYNHSMMNNNMSHAEHREYSRHSVADRIVSIIEKSPELNNMTKFEQDEVRRVIGLIRTAE